MRTEPAPSPLITVVVPAYNAAVTLARTLASVQAQTYSHLEILVVDDGSTDATVDVARAAQDTDPRIRVLRQANAGVAAARNTGIHAASGEYVAPIDADDLWHPTKLQKQLAVFQQGPSHLGLVYSNFRLIDEDDQVLMTAPACRVDGWAYVRHIAHNLVGNGSAVMFRRDMALSVGGYDAALRAQGAEGCEDFLFQLQMARLGPFGVAPEPLVGYRRLPGAMSADKEKMLRSRILALEILEADEAPAADVIRQTKATINFWLGLVMAGKLRLLESGRFLLAALGDASPGNLLEIARYVQFRGFRRLSNARQASLLRRGSAARFLDLPPDVSDEPFPAYVTRTLERLRSRDVDYGRDQEARLGRQPVGTHRDGKRLHDLRRPAEAHPGALA